MKRGAQQSDTSWCWEMNTVNVNTPVTPAGRIRRLYELVGEPLSKIPVVHVGGTNGKGSVSFKLSKVLQQSGLGQSLFVSSHLLLSGRAPVMGTYL